MALVVDTNVLLSTRELVGELIDSARAYGFIVVIPWAVVMELDSLKDRGNSQARAAAAWLYELMAHVQPAGLRVQKPAQVTKHGLSGDDAILDCCLYLMHREGLMVVLFSNDKNLSTRAIVEDVPTALYSEGLTSKTICDAVASRLEEQMVEDAPEFEPSTTLEPNVNELRTTTDVDIDMINDNDNPSTSYNEPSTKRHGHVHLEKMPLRTSTGLAQLCRDVKNTLVTNACTLANARMRDAFSQSELESLQYAGMPDNEKDLAKMLKLYKIAVFGEYFRGLNVEQLAQTRLSANPTRSELETYVAAWASINVRLAGQDLPEFAEAANSVSRAVERYYA